MKLLREKYRTWEGAMKRCAFENAMAEGEYRRGDKARLYRYRVIEDHTTSEVHFRVAREVKANKITTAQLLAGKLF